MLDEEALAALSDKTVGAILKRESQYTQSLGLRFRALLTENGDQNVRLCGA